MSSADVVSREYSDLFSRIAVLEGAASKTTPWYRSASNIISFAAFLFSLTTAVVSYRRDSNQDIHNFRVELRTLLQRLDALPKEQFDSYQKFKNDMSTYQEYSSLINQENVLISRQAEDVIKKLPADQVAATDYIAVAMALQFSGNYDGAEKNYEKALTVADDLNDLLGCYRALGGLQMIAGHVGNGRTQFQKAEDLFADRPGVEPTLRSISNVATEIYWGSSELYIGNVDGADQHASQASRLVRTLPPGPPTDGLAGQLSALQSNIAQRKSNGSATPLIPIPGQAILTIEKKP